MLAVLQGAPVILNYKALIHKSDEAIEGLRSLQGVDRMISDLRTKLPFLFKHLVGPLVTFCHSFLYDVWNASRSFSSRNQSSVVINMQK